MHCLESQAAQGEAVTIRNDGGLRDDQRNEVVYQPNWVLNTWSAVPVGLYSYFGYRN